MTTWLDADGRPADNVVMKSAHQMGKSFFASFFSKKEVLSCLEAA
jgi:hypothetical protein